jgi:hypothetical protein
MKNGQTSHDRTVCASPSAGGSGYEKPQSGYALCAVFRSHVLPALVLLRKALIRAAKTSLTAGR